PLGDADNEGHLTSDAEREEELYVEFVEMHKGYKRSLYLPFIYYMPPPRHLFHSQSIARSAMRSTSWQNARPTVFAGKNDARPARLNESKQGGNGDSLAPHDRYHNLPHHPARVALAIDRQRCRAARQAPRIACDATGITQT